MSWARRLFIKSLSAMVGGCSPVDLVNATVSREGYTIQRDISYGAFTRLKLDYYSPIKPRPDGKTVVFLYGGSWDSGQKSDYLFVGQALASHGIATIIPDYRLFPEVRFPAFIEDCALATRWAADHAGVDKLFLMGHSAGAHIALMLAANTPYLANCGVDRLKLRSAIGLSGPYDFLPLTSTKLISIFGSADNPDIEPITFAKRPLPAVLLIHGTADTIVSPSNSKHLAAAWCRSGAPTEFKLYPGVSHIDVIASFASLLHQRAPTRDDVLTYIAAQ